MKELQKTEVNFTCERLSQKADIEQEHVSVSHILNLQKYFHLQSRWKGFMAEEDHIIQVKFVLGMEDIYS